MSVLKASAVISEPVARADYLAKIQAYLDSALKVTWREATVVEENGAIRAKAIFTTNQRGRQAYNAAETSMVDHAVGAGSWLRLSADDGTVLASREW